MKPVQATLIADGRSDRVLIPVIAWLLRECGLHPVVQWADLDVLPIPPRSLSERAARALDLYPADILFIHRDAENQPRAARVQEIGGALADHAGARVCLVPVRMTEAWFLFDEVALRCAAGNPSGSDTLDLPAVGQVEALVDPKAILHDALRAASGLPPRRRQRFDPGKAYHRLAQLIETFAPLRELTAFREFEEETRKVVEPLGVGTRGV